MENKANMPNKPKRPAWGWGLLALGALERLVGWGGSIDFMLARWNEPAWVGKVLSIIQQYSNILGLVALLAGFVALIRHERKRNEYLYGSVIFSGGNPASTGLATVDSRDEIIACGSNEQQAEAESLIYVGSAIVHIDRMNEDNRAEIAIIAFNGNDFPVKITAPRNHISMSYQASESETAEESLSTPILLTDRGSIVAAPRSEFMIVLHQFLTPAQIAAIKSALALAHVTFNLLALEIDVESDDEKGAVFRIPFTRSPNVSLTKAGEYKNNYTIFAWAKEVIGAPDSTLR